MELKLDTVCWSNAIFQALQDLEKVEKSEYFEVNMNSWGETTKKLVHSFAGQNIYKCSVCFAGAVMCQAEGWKPWTNPTDFDLATKETLRSLDSLRKYCYRCAIFQFFRGYYPDLEKKLNNLIKDKKQYHEDPEVFKRNMKKIATYLRDNGM